ncbi:MAG: hypothetical protein WC394_01620 [Candidatus Omnitrophota bacterium]
MRDLLFKNLTSNDRKKRVISSSEITDKEGVRSIIRRHFVCMVKETRSGETIDKPAPYLYVLKEHNSEEHKERFFCKVKGSVCALNQGRLFLIVFMHSLRIDLVSTPQNAI